MDLSDIELFQAITSDDTIIINKFINERENLNFRNDFGRTPLMSAIEKKKI
ncbi:MAG: hypothetical protein Edafosvirus19_13 [Edafosvirus sp.]|uniref:Ankyrin repeat domain-containing protein n=1 Tax=Edafosvirus sp. TaxID=2487765 RepID=A0A3G4ZUK3_9VIRU|nr:MAG: hypothetical protein Edafosvirus19_13 [Edafosvirus sp.]